MAHRTVIAIEEATVVVLAQNQNVVVVAVPARAGAVNGTTQNSDAFIWQLFTEYVDQPGHLHEIEIPHLNVTIVLVFDSVLDVGPSGATIERSDTRPFYPEEGSHMSEWSPRARAHERAALRRRVDRFG